MDDHHSGPGSQGEELTILVLGVGGNVSQGIMKALAAGSLSHRLVAACVSPYSAGLHVADRAYVSPFADDPAFGDWLFNTCEAEGVDVVLSGVEPVLGALAGLRDDLRDRTGAVALVSDPDQLDVGLDKLRTARWLEEQGLNFARSADAGDAAAVAALAAETGTPLLAKPRRGKGSEGVLTIDEPSAVAELDGYVVQELLGTEESEYTAATLNDDAGQVAGVMVMKRRLQAGTTFVAEAGEFPEVRTEAIRIAEALGARGPANVQLRVHDGRPTCFEINCRFSGTAPIRAQLGFNDVEAAIRHYALGEPLAPLPVIRQGTAVRYWNEVYPEGADLSELEAGRSVDPSGRAEGGWR